MTGLLAGPVNAATGLDAARADPQPAGPADFTVGMR
jgi:hypothetical protein